MKVWALTGSHGAKSPNPQPGKLGHLGRFVGKTLPDPRGYPSGTTCEYCPDAHRPEASMILVVVQVVS